MRYRCSTVRDEMKNISMTRARNRQDTIKRTWIYLKGGFTRTLCERPFGVLCIHTHVIRTAEHTMARTRQSQTADLDKVIPTPPVNHARQAARHGLQRDSAERLDLLLGWWRDAQGEAAAAEPKGVGRRPGAALLFSPLKHGTRAPSWGGGHLRRCCRPTNATRARPKPTKST